MIFQRSRSACADEVTLCFPRAVWTLERLTIWTCAGSKIGAEPAIVQPLVSVAVTEYAPAVRFEMVAVVAPVFQR